MSSKAVEPAFHARRFDRAAASYEASASVQARMADVLLELCREEAPPANILEFGCGTGLLTRKIWKTYRHAKILATDASPRMLHQAAGFFPPQDGRLNFALLDAENPKANALPPPVPPFTLAVSNALTQWFPNLGNHLRYASSVTDSSGMYLLSGFARSNFPELNSLLAEPPFSYQKFPGHEPEAFIAALPGTGWELEKIRSWEEKEILPSARDVLHRIRDLGSSRDPREGGKMNRNNLEKLLRDYETRFRVQEGVRLTWRPWAAMLRKTVTR